MLEIHYDNPEKKEGNHMMIKEHQSAPSKQSLTQFLILLSENPVFLNLPSPPPSPPRSHSPSASDFYLIFLGVERGEISFLSKNTTQ